MRAARNGANKGSPEPATPGPAARSFPTGQARGLKAHADAHDGIMVRIKRSYRIQILCSGTTNSDKSTSSTTEPTERPNASRYYSSRSRADRHPRRLGHFIRL